MALIDSEDAAGRLARVIVSDIALYNQQKLDSGADLGAELEEGYAHFRSRVVPALLPLFERVLADHGRFAGRLPRSLVAGRRLPAARRPEREPAAPLFPPASEPATAPLSVPVTAPLAIAEPAAAPPLVAEAVTAPLAVSETEATRAPEPEPDEPAVADEPPVDEPTSTTQVDATALPEEPEEPEEPMSSDDPTAPSAMDPEAAAERLARVIVSDIAIYNPDKIASGGDLTREINEGRALFRSRVHARLLPLFEAELQVRGLAGGLGVARPRTKTPAAAAPAPRPDEIPTPPPRAPDPGEIPTPLPTGTPGPIKLRPRALPPPLPLDDRPRWAASEPALPVEVLARLPEPAPGGRRVSETPEVVVTLAAGFDPTPAPAPAPSPFAEPQPSAGPAPAPASDVIAPALLTGPAPGVLPTRAPVQVAMTTSAARPARPTPRRWLPIILALAAAAALAYHFLPF